jgi:LPS sulfotransferase NodH
MQGPPNSYVICATPRCGGNLLSDYLDNTGVLGRPQEFLNPRLVRDGAYGLRFDKPAPISVAEYIAWLSANMRSRNGVLGIKVLYDDFVAYRGFPAFQALLARSVLFYLSRRAKVQQAISHYLARATGQWRSDDQAAVPADSVPYDFTAIDQSLQTLYHQDVEWRAFLSCLERDVTFVEYEDLVDDPAAVIARFGQGLGIDVAGTAPVTTLRPLRGEQNSSFFARYKEDLLGFYHRPTAQIEYEGMILRP